MKYLRRLKSIIRMNRRKSVGIKQQLRVEYVLKASDKNKVR